MITVSNIFLLVFLCIELSLRFGLYNVSPHGFKGGVSGIRYVTHILFADTT
jgi:hypothetical protein